MQVIQIGELSLAFYRWLHREVVESIDEDGRVFDELSLRGCVAALDGSDVIRASGIGSPGGRESSGARVAAELFDLGAREAHDQCAERAERDKRGRSRDDDARGGRRGRPRRVRWARVLGTRLC